MTDYYALADATSALELGCQSPPWPHAKQPAVNAPNCCKLSFAVGSRGDMRVVMRPLFQRLGLCEETSAVHVLWVEPMERETKFYPLR